MGNSTALVARDMATSRAKLVATLIGLLGSGLLRVLAGSARIFFGVMVGSLAQRASGARNIARGAGLIAGATGFTYTEYARHDIDRSADA